MNIGQVKSFLVGHIIEFLQNKKIMPPHIFLNFFDTFFYKQRGTLNVFLLLIICNEFLYTKFYATNVGERGLNTY